MRVPRPCHPSSRRQPRSSRPLRASPRRPGPIAGARWACSPTKAPGPSIPEADSIWGALRTLMQALAMLPADRVPKALRASVLLVTLFGADGLAFLRDTYPVQSEQDESRCGGGGGSWWNRMNPGGGARGRWLGWVRPGGKGGGAVAMGAREQVKGKVGKRADSVGERMDGRGIGRFVRGEIGDLWGCRRERGSARIVAASGGNRPIRGTRDQADRARRRAILV